MVIDWRANIEWSTKIDWSKKNRLEHKLGVETVRHKNSGMIEQPFNGGQVPHRGRYFFDTHCHWDHVIKAFSTWGRGESLNTLVEKATAVGLGGMVIPGISVAQWAQLLPTVQAIQASTAQDIPVGFALGCHPWFLPDVLSSSERLPEIYAYLTQAVEVFIDQPLWVAIGETGLDAMRPIPMARQLLWLEAHLQLAATLQMPIILHCVKAHQPMISLLKRYHSHGADRPKVRGVIHAFSGSYELGKTYQRLGFHLGIGGTCTYSRAKKTHRAIEQLPLECLLLETDAPWMPLHGYQGEPNHPQQIARVAERIAELKRVTLAEVASVTYQNAIDLFFPDY